MAVLAICDKEAAFVKILADYLKRKYRSEIEIEAFDNGEKLSSLYKEKNVSVCLVGEGMLSAYQTEEALKNSEQVIYLTKKRKEEGVFKYQSVEDITKDLMELCVRKEIFLFDKNAFCIKKENIRIVGFYSPVHHVLQSSLALTMGQLLAKDKKVLYLNFEPYSGFEYMMQKNYEHDLMDILFFLKEEPRKFRMKLDSIMEKIGQLDYIPPVFCYPDMEEIDAILWQKLLERLINEMDYDVIILDLTEQIRGLFSMLELCDEIYSFLAEDGLAMAKMDQYEKVLLHMKKEIICEHTKKCIVPRFQEVPSQAAMFTHSQLAEYIKEIMKNHKNNGEDGKIGKNKGME